MSGYISNVQELTALIVSTPAVMLSHSYFAINIALNKQLKKMPSAVRENGPASGLTTNLVL